MGNTHCHNIAHDHGSAHGHDGAHDHGRTYKQHDPQRGTSQKSNIEMDLRGCKIFNKKI